MRISAEEFVVASLNTPVLDVRSPGEFKKGHLPNAHSFPLFSDSERAEIGTLYKQVGQKQAMERGLDLVSPKIRTMVVQAQELATEGRLLVHCWRGGLRSESVGNLLKIAGIDTKILEGGYKAYRQWVLKRFEMKYQFRIVGGMTGSGKTEVLKSLSAAGERIVDLEELADHRGSAFGRLGSIGRVSQAQFENGLAIALHEAKDEVIWLEDESRQIGSLTIPSKIWEQMRNAPFYFLNPGKEDRIERLMRDYGHFSKIEIRESVDRIKKRLGGLRHQQAISLLDENRGVELTNMLLDYYDKSYHHAMISRESKIRFEIDPGNMEMSSLASYILGMEQN